MRTHATRANVVAAKFRYLVVVSFLAVAFPVATYGQGIRGMEKTDIPRGFADTYFSAFGFDIDNDGQPDDTIQLGQGHFYAAPIPNLTPARYLESGVGGIVASTASYAAAADELSEAANQMMRGNGTFENPDHVFGPELDPTALSYRRILFATGGEDGLVALFTQAIPEFMSKLELLLKAEEAYRMALRTDPFNEGALNGLLEVFYARAEGFMLIGNEYIARGLGHKFFRANNPQESRSIREVELDNLGAALTAYSQGFREFNKLFNHSFTDLAGVRKDYLGLNAGHVFFSRTYPEDGEYVVFESKRGATNAVGESTKAFPPNYTFGDDLIAPVQGAPGVLLTVTRSKNAKGTEPTMADGLREEYDKELAAENKNQSNIIVTPVRFLTPVPSGPTGRGATFTVQFPVEIHSSNPVGELQALIEFDAGIVDPPSEASDITIGTGFDLVSFRPAGNGNLEANQILITLRSESATGISGLRAFATVPFRVKDDAIELKQFRINLMGSADARLSGYKDVTLLFQLAAARATTVTETARRMYVYQEEDSDPEEAAFAPDEVLAFIDQEGSEIRNWVTHIETLLDEGATEAELALIDPLHAARSTVNGRLSELEGFARNVRDRLNPYGYPADYVPFYDSPNSELAAGVDAYDALKNIIEAQDGPYGVAREKEWVAIANLDKFTNSRDRIRNELFTIDQDVETRLAQICGRIGTGANAPIDYELVAAFGDAACEIGQATIGLDIAQLNLDYAEEKLADLKRDVDIKIRALEKVLRLEENSRELLAEFSSLQQNLDKKLGEIAAKQTRLNAFSQAAKEAIGTNGWVGYIEASFVQDGFRATISVANGLLQADLEKEKAAIQAEKTRLSYDERIKLSEIGSEIRSVEGYAQIETLANDAVAQQILIQVEKARLATTLGQLYALFAERDELLARRSRQIANLGEMSFANPAFRLYQFKAMTDADSSLEVLKKWLYLLTVALQYKWALPLDYEFSVDARIAGVEDIGRIRVVGDYDGGSGISPILDGNDAITAAEYIEVLQSVDDLLELNQGTPCREWNPLTTASARFSLREDFLRIVRTANTTAEDNRVKKAFQDWLQSRRLGENDPRGDKDDVLIEFDTISHLDGYNTPVNENSTWRSFALRTFNEANPQFNHKITGMGAAFRFFGTGFLNGVDRISIDLRLGGAGFVRRNSLYVEEGTREEFEVYSLAPWIYNPLTKEFTPRDFRTITLDMRNSNDITSTTTDFLSSSLSARPVAASTWQLLITKEEMANVNLSAIEDIVIYVNSTSCTVQ